MTTSSPTAPFLRSLLGSVALLGCILLVNACSSSKSTQKTDTSTRTLRLTAYDSTSGEPLDSATAINRTMGDSMKVDSGASFVMKDVEPALYVFNLKGYGYHTQRHVSVLVEPEDTARTARVPLLPKLLTLTCDGSRPFNWDTMVSRYKKDSSRVGIKLIDAFARDGKVRIQPVLVNRMPTSTLFLPDNFGKLGHYEVQLYDGDNNRVDYRHEDAPHDSGHRIYSKGDILPAVAQAAERLAPSTLVLEDSVSDGETLYARLRYTFSTSDTLRATSETTFPDLKLDSLQVPIFDTLRTDGRVRVPDSLVIQRDTTEMQIVGLDTTVTRRGYVLFSTLRDSNAVSSPDAARKLLYVPDSIKSRVRQDSLRAAVRADTSVPAVDTSAALAPDTKFRVVDRTDRARVDSLIPNDELAQSLGEGLPDLDISIDSLLSVTPFVRQSFLNTPTLSKIRTRRGLDTVPDSTFRDSLLLSGPTSDSLFRAFDPDSLTLADSTVDRSIIRDTLGLEADTSLDDRAVANAIFADSSLIDTTLTDTTVEVTRRRNPFLLGPLDPLTPESDSIPIDSLHLTIPLEADSVVTDSVVDDYLQDPPAYSYWQVPDSLSLWRTKVMVVDPIFFRLRARGRVDTSAAFTIGNLLPDRVGPRDDIALKSFPQQVIRYPIGTYRDKYLKAWKQLQTENLKKHYCRIFPFPLRSEWRSMSMY